MASWTFQQIQAIKAILRMYETNSITGHHDLLVVLDDGAGITFGVEQTTENSGGLHRLLTRYLGKKNALYKAGLEPFMDRLFDGKNSKLKFGLTNNAEFKQLLVKAARHDPLMRAAQERHFEKNFLHPALELAAQYSMTLPLSLAVIYDSCIHSGPGDWKAEVPKKWGAALLMWNYDAKHPDNDKEQQDLPDTAEDETMCGAGGCVADMEGDPLPWSDQQWEDAEKEWIKGYVLDRLEWLAGHKRQAVRQTTYRMHAFLKLMEDDKWDLDLPFELHRSKTGKRYKRPPVITADKIAPIQVVSKAVLDHLQDQQTPA